MVSPPPSIDPVWAKKIQDQEKSIIDLGRKLDDLNRQKAAAVASENYTQAAELKNLITACEEQKKQLDSTLATLKNQAIQESQKKKFEQQQQLMEVRNALAKVNELKMHAVASEDYVGAANYKKQIE